MAGIFRLLAVSLALATLTGCVTSQAPQDWGAVVIDLRPADTTPATASTSTLERPWIGFGLAKPGAPESEQPTPSTLHMRLRTGDASEADPKGERLQMMEVTGIDIGRPTSVEPSATEARTGPLVIAVDPPGASITLTGAMIEWPYSKKEPVVGGIARITFNRGFLDAARRADPQASTELLLRAALMNVTTADLRQYNQLELQPTLEQIIQLVIAKVTPSEIQNYYQAGYAFKVPELMELKRVGVDVSHAVGFAEGGFEYKAADLIALHRAGVEPGYAIGLKQAGFADGVEMVIRLKKAGVEPKYAHRMRDLGVAPNVDTLVRLHDNDISPESVETFQRAKYDFNAEQLIMLDDAGVVAQDTLYLREAGYDFTIEDLVKLARWKVPTQFTLSLVSDDFELMSADQIVELRLRRVTPDMVSLIRQNRAPGQTGATEPPAAQLPMPQPLPELEPVEAPSVP